MIRVERALAELPAVVRYAVIGAVVAGVPGAAVGLALGFVAYPATAWFALFEIGLPAAMLGAVLGLLIGAAEGGTNKIVNRKR